MGALNLVAKITANEMIAKNHFRMQIEAQEIAALAIPGQFVMLKAQSKSYDPLVRIPLGVHQKHADGISVLYHVVGNSTEILSQLRAGDTVEILGPLGNGFKQTLHKNSFLIAGGVGSAPLYFLAETLLQQQKNVAVFLGAKTKDLIVGADDFKKLGATVYIATEDGSCGEKCLVTQLLELSFRSEDWSSRGLTAGSGKQLDLKLDTAVKPRYDKVEDIMLYATGPNPMLKAVARIAREQNIPAQLLMEAYMACGIGACRGCAIETNEGYKMCCQDGPVFDVGNI
ncbi:MAG: dihydroorotate dehydrogenase electron transfer subunit [Gammaproteobacteria bacterium]|jgi:dihydroorotate dehydrogenase electron transfer subunit